MKHNKGVLHTKDKVALAYEHDRNGFPSLIIVCPGFFNSKKNRWMRKTTELLSNNYDTLIFDFRGHGESGGKFTWSAKEHIDVETVLDYAKGYNYEAIGILAYSLGAAASINAVSRRGDVKSMVLISCPYSFWQINYHFWEPEMFLDLKDNFECDWDGKGAKVGSLLTPKPKPINEVKKIKDVSIFYIHGMRDWIIKSSHSKKLYEATKCLKRIELIKDGLHAERMVQEDTKVMKALFLDWFSKTLK